MANVFGEPVDGRTRVERALKAMANPNAGGKRDAAIAYVKEQKQKFGDGVSTESIFYNATGETLSYLEDHSKYGKIYDSYPTIVQNGQWGAFLHVKKPFVPSANWLDKCSSEAFVAYRGKYNDTNFCKQLIAWDVPLDQAQHDNCAYNEIYDDNSEIDKDKVYKEMEAGGRQHTTNKKGMSITSIIEVGTSPLYEAQFTLSAPLHGRATS